MKIIQLLIVTLLTTTAHAAVAEKTCEVLEPGKRLGDRFSIGTVLKAEKSVAPDALPGWHRPTDPAGKAVRLRFDADKKLVEFEAPLPACVQLGSRRVETASVHVLAAALGTCGPEKMLEGGNIMECSGVTLVTSGGAAAIRIAAPAGACSTYVAQGSWFDAGGAHPAKGTELAVGEPMLCLPNVTRPLNAKTSLADFKALGLPCREDAARGGTQLVCGDTTYSFAGPTLLLTRVGFAR